MDELNNNGMLKFEDGGTGIELTKDDLLIDMTQQEGYVTQEDGDITVVLDTNLTPELIEEGYVLELISKIQTMRKDSGFEVMDRIHVALSGNDKLYDIAARNAASITGKVLADEIGRDESLANEKDWDINGENVKIGVEKLG